MKSKFLLSVLLISVIFLASCAPKEALPERDDFDCWPPSCSFIPDQQGKQMCEDWKAGKEVQWFDCSMMAAFPKCVKLCEFEKKNNPQGSQNFTGNIYSQGQVKQDPGIPARDPGAENVYIYVLDVTPENQRIV